MSKPSESGSANQTKADVNLKPPELETSPSVPLSSIRVSLRTWAVGPQLPTPRLEGQKDTQVLSPA